MEKTKNDNRMLWIRNIDKLKESEDGSYFFDFEIATERHIGGVLDYEEGKIRCGMFTLERDRNGLFHYLLRIQFPKIDEYYNENADEEGYFFVSVLEELLSLFSLFFQCRFYLVATYSGELDGEGSKTKTEHNFLYKSCDYNVHPKIFKHSNNNFSLGLSDFLDLIRELKVEKHYQFILCCYNYSKALKEIGVDREMVFIRLVSSIEILSEDFNLSEKDNPLNNKNFKDIILNKLDLTILQEEQFWELLNVNKEGLIKIKKTSKKFIQFIKEYSKGALKGGNYKGKKITKINLIKTLRKIYCARSKYLHSGYSMYLSNFMRGFEKYDMDPSLGTTADNRRLKAKNNKMPYESWFENIVRCCLLNYVKRQVSIVRSREYYVKLRDCFIPKNIKVIFIFESPPSNCRFFYDKTAKARDGEESLFREMMKLIDYKINGDENKKEGLELFRKVGFLLVDSTYTPIDYLSAAKCKNMILQDLSNLKNDLNKIIKDKVKIILVKSNVCKLLEKPLKDDGFNIANNGRVIPYPGCGQQEKFRRAIGEII